MPGSQLLNAPGNEALRAYWNIQVDLENASGIVLEQPVVTDGNWLPAGILLMLLNFPKQ